MSYATTPSRTLDLPFELVDNIIDLLQEDGNKRHLSSYSLISRAWLTRSRQHLFSSIRLRRLDDRRGLEAFLEFLVSNNSEENIRSRGTNVNNFIKELRFHGQPGRRMLDLVKANILKGVLALLPNLLSLELRHAQLEWDVPFSCRDTQDATSHRCAKLESLTLDTFQTSSPSSSDLVFFLSLFSSIAALRIFSPDLGYIPENMESIANHPSLLTTQPCFPSQLQVSSINLPNGAFTPFFLALLQRTTSTSSLREMDTRCSSRTEIDALGIFLDVVGTRIKSFAMDIVQFEESGRMPSYPDLQAFNLSACTSLTHLTIRISLRPNHGTRNSAMFTSVTTLLSFASATLETITLIITLEGPQIEFYRFEEPLRDDLTQEFLQLQAGILQRQGKGKEKCKLVIGWAGFRWHGKTKGTFCENEDELCEIVQDQLTELNNKGLFTFA
ncbi:hypothetical protein PHLCEN_2v5235 [Hermanssonia centrifuga]|uniref:F-box domain-containing protein n=1 Tax=Hermanssonia centrifuga TaxID=98765 RepID=A0A2R6P8L0_9APHY|nr:hypothetical protein PHLCEN_2v5235 [Hermanssonia centrifuga]